MRIRRSVWERRGKEGGSNKERMAERELRSACQRDKFFILTVVAFFLWSKKVLPRLFIINAMIESSFFSSPIPRHSSSSSFEKGRKSSTPDHNFKKEIEKQVRIVFEKNNMNSTDYKNKYCGRGCQKIQKYS